MNNFDELEKVAEKYVKLKGQNKMDGERIEIEGELNNIKNTIIGYLSSPEFAFPLEKEALVSNGTTTYVYRRHSTFPNLFEFISQLLQKPIPIVLEGAKFGPGEIIVNGDNEEAARSQLSHCVIVLQKLILNKKSNRSSF
ncbi:MAG TPA: hypothetical protein VEP90_21960 [Methylomirabilota bacterium]|nr:hypothetical protein [Methylomirabilota bacterium]